MSYSDLRPQTVEDEPNEPNRTPELCLVRERAGLILPVRTSVDPVIPLSLHKAFLCTTLDSGKTTGAIRLQVTSSDRLRIRLWEAAAFSNSPARLP